MARRSAKPGSDGSWEAIGAPTKAANSSECRSRRKATRLAACVSARRRIGRMIASIFHLRSHQFFWSLEVCFCFRFSWTSDTGTSDFFFLSLKSTPSPFKESSEDKQSGVQKVQNYANRQCRISLYFLAANGSSEENAQELEVNFMESPVPREDRQL